MGLCPGCLTLDLSPSGHLRLREQVGQSFGGTEDMLGQEMISFSRLNIGGVVKTHFIPTSSTRGDIYMLLICSICQLHLEGNLIATKIVFSGNIFFFQRMKSYTCVPHEGHSEVFTMDDGRTKRRTLTPEVGYCILSPTCGSGPQKYFG